MNTLTAAVVASAKRDLGVTLSVEGVGGGSTVLSGPLSDGRTLVLADGNLGHELESECWVWVFTPGTWTDQDGTGQHPAAVELFAALPEHPDFAWLECYCLIAAALAVPVSFDR